MPERLEETLRRLTDEREQADRRYNDALTALDRSLAAALGEIPAPPPGYDAHQAAALNEAWNVAAAPPRAGGVRGAVGRIVWRVLAPYFQRQLTFNSWLVDHLNRNLESQRQAHRAAEEAAAVLRERFTALAAFQSHLIQYLQQITPYVDTRDREAAGGALVLNASISGLAEALDKRWESMRARDARLESRTAAIETAQADLQSAVTTAHQAALTVKREIERIARTGAAVAPAGANANAAPAPAEFGALDAYKYVGFEDRFRGSREAIRARLDSYLPFFAGASDVLDVGCGRGEFLELLAGTGVNARGIDLNAEMVEVCRARGLDAAVADAVGYLQDLPDGALGGLFAAQVVEHLAPAYLLRFLDLAFQKVRPGGRVVLETLNPACWVAFFDSFIRDITHVWPLHPETLRYLAAASGFHRVDVEYRSPVAPQDKLQMVASADPALADLVEMFNANVEKLNSRMFTHLDYAIIAVR